MKVIGIGIGSNFFGIGIDICSIKRIGIGIVFPITNGIGIGIVFGQSN